MRGKKLISRCSMAKGTCARFSIASDATLCYTVGVMQTVTTTSSQTAVAFGHHAHHHDNWDNFALG